MSPPAFFELGKEAREVLQKGYYFGLVKLGLKTKTCSGVDFSAGGTYETENSSVFGSLESKYFLKEKGATFVERWNTDNVLGAEVTLKDYFLKNLVLGAEYNFAPTTGKKCSRIKSSFTKDCAHLTAEIDESMAIHGSAVVEYRNFMAGYQCAYDTDKKELLKNNIAFTIAATNLMIHASINNLNDYGTTIFQRINHKWDTCIHMSWDKDSNGTKFGVGGKYILDTDASLKIKVDNSCLLGLSYQQRIREGIALTLCALIDCKNFDSGGHKIGLALEMEA